MPRGVLIGGAAVALIAIVVVFLISPTGGRTSARTQSDAPAAASASPSVDLTGSYDELVARANGLYDKGSAQFSSGKFETATKTFAAAATTYGAAWRTHPGSASVGTDWATSLFYSGDIEGALKRVEVVIRKSPSFQPAWFNKGNFLAHSAAIIRESGDETVAKKAEQQAIAAFRRAAQIDPQSEIGKQAAERAKSLSSQ